MKNSMEFPQKSKNRIMVQSSNLLLGIYTKKTKTLSQNAYAHSTSVHLQEPRQGSNLSVHQQMNG